MKVALIHYRLIHFGGLETRLKNYIRYFHERGDEVTVICTKYDPAIRLPENTNVVKLSPGMALKVFRQSAFNKKLGAYMQEHAYDFSLSLFRTSHQQYVLCPGNHLGYMRATLKKHMTVNDRMQVKSDRDAYTYSRLIFAASGMMQQELQSLYGVDPSKIRLLHPPIDEKRFNRNESLRTATRAKLGLDASKKYFLFASLGHGRKGLPLLLEVFKKLQHTGNELLIMGGPVVKTGLSNVRYLGFFEDPAAIYNAADFLVHPSIYEPYGQIVAEALQCGIPAIVSKNTGASEIIGNREGLVIDHFDAGRWAEILSGVRREDFSIPDNIAVSKGITLHHHMQKMMHFAGILP